MNNMFNSNDFDNNNSKTKEVAGQALKSLWKKLPLKIKLAIIGGLGGAALFAILIMAVASASPLNWLFYSDDVQEKNTEVDEAYEEYWDEFCSESSNKCTEEQKKAAEDLKKDQELFYERLDKLSNEYLSNDAKEKKEQRYIILTTVFYGYDIDKLTQGEAFTLEESGKDEMTVSETEKPNAYKQETDTLKELVKQFKITTSVCTYTDGTDENGEPITKEFTLENEDGEAFSFNFFEKLQFNMRLYSTPEYEKAKEKCTAVGGEVSVKELKEGKASTDAFYRYLEESPYLDSRFQHKGVYAEYAKKHNLSSTDPKDWPEEDRKGARKIIIEDIKNIVETKISTEEENPNTGTLALLGSSKQYWWPIGSKETTTIDGKLFATGAPQFLGYNDHYGGARNHKGTDINAGFNEGKGPQAYIIAAKDGVVSQTVSSCAPFTRNGSCGSGWGNHVRISASDGNLNLYAHLSQVFVNAGDEVKQGQVLGIGGNSGDSDGVHLHFEVWLNGDYAYRVNPELTPENPNGFVDITNPRPKVTMVPDEYLSVISNEEYAKLEQYVDNFEGTTGGTVDENGNYTVLWGNDRVHTVGHGVTLENNPERFARRGIDISKYKYSGAKIPQSIVDDVRTEVILEKYYDITQSTTNAGNILNFEQRSALVSFAYNWGSIKDFNAVYKRYGDTEEFNNHFFLTHIGDCYDCEYYWGLLKRRKREWNLFHNHIWE